MKASYSVEGSWIFGITMVVIYLMLAFSFELYSNVSETIENTKIEDSDSVRKFRLLQMGKSLVEVDGE